MGQVQNLSETTQPNGFVTSRTVPETTGFERTPKLATWTSGLYGNRRERIGRGNTLVVGREVRKGSLLSLLWCKKFCLRLCRSLHGFLLV
jgi:hypothetical protein